MSANTNAKIKRGLVGYVLLTSGAKPKSNPGQHPRALVQVRNLKAFSTEYQIEVIGPTWDYTRRLRRLSDLPTLEKHLKHMKDLGKGAVLMDDIGRIIRACPLVERQALIEDLFEFGAHIAGLRQGVILSEMPLARGRLLVHETGPVRFEYKRKLQRTVSRAKKKHTWQTEDARKASIVSRSAQADENAQKLAKIRDDLKKSNTKVTNAAIAEEANRTGFKTARGKEWRPDTVFKTLARFDKTESVVD